MRSNYIEIVEITNDFDPLVSWFVDAGIDGNNQAWVAPSAEFLDWWLEDDDLSEDMVLLGFVFSLDGESVGASQASIFYCPFGYIKEL